MADISGKKEAQQRVDSIHAFRRELDQLAREGILVLSSEDRARVDSHTGKLLADLALDFDVDVSDSQKRISLAMRIASTLGGLALCAAIFLFFFRYWGLLSTSVQVAIIVAIPILALIATEIASRKEKTYYYTSLLAIIAFGSFVMNLNVLGGIFNLAPSSTAFLAWGLFGLLLAYGYRLKLQLAAGLICLTIYFAATIVILSGGFWGSVIERPETLLLAGALLLAVPALFRHAQAPGFAVIYRLLGLLLVFLALLVLGNEGQLTYLPWSKKTVQGLYQFGEFGSAVAVIWIGVRKRYAECLNLGSAFFAIYTFNRLFAWWWDFIPNYLFFLIIGVIALALLAVFRRIRNRSTAVEAA